MASASCCPGRRIRPRTAGRRFLVSQSNRAGMSRASKVVSWRAVEAIRARLALSILLVEPCDTLARVPRHRSCWCHRMRRTRPVRGRRRRSYGGEADPVRARVKDLDGHSLAHEVREGGGCLRGEEGEDQIVDRELICSASGRASTVDRQQRPDGARDRRADLEAVDLEIIPAHALQLHQHAQAPSEPPAILPHHLLAAQRAAPEAKGDEHNRSDDAHDGESRAAATGPRVGDMQRLPVLGAVGAVGAAGVGRAVRAAPGSMRSLRCIVVSLRCRDVPDSFLLVRSGVRLLRYDDDAMHNLLLHHLDVLTDSRQTQLI
eukprot:148042-Hanusia_phi.AAC.1